MSQGGGRQSRLCQEAVQKCCRRDVLAQVRETWQEQSKCSCCILEEENGSTWSGPLQAVFDDAVLLQWR